MSQKLHHHPPTPLTPSGWFPGCWSWTPAREINYFSFRITKWCESESCSMDSWRPCGLHSPWKSPGQNTRVGSLSLLHRVFPTQRLNPGFPHCRWILYQLSHQGSLMSPSYLLSVRHSWSQYNFVRILKGGLESPVGKLRKRSYGFGIWVNFTEEIVFALGL